MSKLRLELTNFCNFNCVFCHHDQFYDKEQSKLTAEDYGFLVGVAKKIGFNHIVLSGGEPLSRPDINKIIDRIQENKIYLQITTNGYLLNKLTTPEKINRLNISLHSTMLNIHNNLTKQRFALPKVIENIEKLRDYKNIKKKINVVALKNTTITQENLKQLLNFCFDNELELKIIELLDEQNDNYIPIEEVEALLIKSGFYVIGRRNQNLHLSNNKAKVTLQKCFCKYAETQDKPDLICHEFNDLYVLPSGKLCCCRMKESTINILDDIKYRNEQELQKKIKIAIEKLGIDCPYTQRKGTN